MITEQQLKSDCTQDVIRKEELIIVHNVLKYKGEYYLKQVATNNCISCALYNKTDCYITGNMCCGEGFNWKSFKDIQITEEQARELFSAIGLVETIDMAIDESKKHGYIRKSAVEEAEEMYQEWLYAMEATSSPINKDNLNVKLYEAVQDLKSEIARLKK